LVNQSEGEYIHWSYNQIFVSINAFKDMIVSLLI
jgi:hypothetical protein